MVYDDRHRTFLQAIMQGGAVLDADAMTLCYKIFHERISVSAVAEIINNKLSPIAMAIKSGICELTADKYWCVVGTTHEETLIIPSQFSTGEKTFLRVIYSEIINSEDGCISSTDCLNLHNSVDTGKLSMGDADSFVKLLIRQKWLHCKDGYIYMGVRSIVELMPYFRATFLDNFHNCALCYQVLFCGQKCINCNKMYHYYCIAKYNTTNNGNKCPNCQNCWDNLEIPGEIIDSQTVNEDVNEESMIPNEQSMDVTEEDEAPRKLRKKRKHHF